MNSNTNNTHQGVQPLVADDADSADIKSDEELHGASEDDGPLHQAEEANNSMTISGDGPEILRMHVRNGSIRITLLMQVHVPLHACSCHTSS